MTAIETTELTKRTGPETLVDGVDLCVERGEAFAVVGPNGAGKSTLLALLLGRTGPTAGEVTVFGEDPYCEPGRLSDRVGHVAEVPDLDDRRTGLEHVRYATGVGGPEADPDTTETPADLLDRVGVDPDTAARSAETYSRGTARRVAVAMALAGDPDLLVMDEPAAGLDPAGVVALASILRSERRSGTTVLFAARRLAGLGAVPDRVGVLDGGRLRRVTDVDRPAIDVDRRVTGFGPEGSPPRRHAGVEETPPEGEAVVELRVDSVPAVDLESVPGVEAVETSPERITALVSSPAAKPTVVLEVGHTGVAIRDVTITPLEPVAVHAGRRRGHGEHESER